VPTPSSANTTRFRFIKRRVCASQPSFARITWSEHGHAYRCGDAEWSLPLLNPIPAID
jgi:hypothetical protein